MPDIPDRDRVADRSVDRAFPGQVATMGILRGNPDRAFSESPAICPRSREAGRMLTRVRRSGRFRRVISKAPLGVASGQFSAVMLKRTMAFWRLRVTFSAPSRRNSPAPSHGRIPSRPARLPAGTTQGNACRPARGLQLGLAPQAAPIPISSASLGVQEFFASVTDLHDSAGAAREMPRHG
jgi:hypothetical protein